MTLRESPDLHEQLLELEYIYDAAPVGLVLVDRELRYVRINERLAKINGLPISAHIGRRIREVIPDKADILEPMYRHVLESGVGIMRREVTIESGPGLVSYYVASYYPLRTADGEVGGVCGVIQDATTERRAERELRESEARYRFLAESLPEFVWTTDMAGRVYYCNQHFPAYIGIRREEATSDALTRAVHPADLPVTLERREYARKNRVPFEVELRFRRASDGEYRWHLLRATPFRSASGESLWLATALDIDDRKKAEQAHALVASMVEWSSEAIIGIDSDGCITSWNPAAQNLFGYTAQEVAGRSVAFLNPAQTDEQIHQMMGRVLAGERIERHETIRANKDGRELAVLITVTPIRGESGRVTGAFKTVRDVTEQRRVERELSAAAERLRLVQRAVKAGTWELDFETGDLYRSPEFFELLGMEPGNNFGDIDQFAATVHPEDAEHVRRSLREVSASGRELRLQYRVLRNGEVRWLTAFGSLAGIGGSARMVGITIDTTEIHKTEETVRQTARLEGLGRLAGGVAHDYNNLLAGILGGASFIAETLPDDHAARPMLDLVIRSSERAAHLTKQLLAYAGKGSFMLCEVELSKTVQDAFSLLRGSIPANVELVVQTGWDLPAIEADANQLGEVVLNLVTNAAEAIGDKAGIIRVRTGIERLDRGAIQKRFGESAIPVGTYVYLEVNDSGEGMSPEIQRRIFEPFFTTRFTGRGLGLSAVEGIVRGHHGAIEVRSERGKGSTFRILFPVAAARETGGPVKIEPARHGGLVLVIDDEEGVRNIVQAALARQGYQVLTAADGITGLETFRQRREHVSLVILDISMPRMSGPDVFEEFEKAGIDVPVLITSGYPEREALQRIPPNRVAGFIQKPFNVRELASVISKLIGSPAG